MGPRIEAVGGDCRNLGHRAGAGRTCSDSGGNFAPERPWRCTVKPLISCTSWGRGPLHRIIDGSLGVSQNSVGRWDQFGAGVIDASGWRLDRCGSGRCVATFCHWTGRMDQHPVRTLRARRYLLAGSPDEYAVGSPATGVAMAKGI